MRCLHVWPNFNFAGEAHTTCNPLHTIQLRGWLSTPSLRTWRISWQLCRKRGSSMRRLVQLNSFWAVADAKKIQNCWPDAHKEEPGQSCSLSPGAGQAWLNGPPPAAQLLKVPHWGMETGGLFPKTRLSARSSEKQQQDLPWPRRSV